MTLLFMDGFDMYDPATTFAKGGWTASSSNVAQEATSGRFGGGAVKINGVSGAASLKRAIVPDQPFGTTYFYSFDVKFMSTPSGNNRFCYIRPDAISSAFTLALEITAGVLTFTGGTAPNTQSTGKAFSVGIWYRIEVSLNLTSNASNTGELTIKVDGNTVFTGTGINLRWNSTPTTVGSFLELTSTSSIIAYFDDVVINNNGGSVNNSFLGDVRIDTLRPTGNGTEQDWTPNTGAAWQAIDDPNGASDGDTTYISATTVGDKSEFDVDDLTGTSSNILGVQVRGKMMRTDAGAKTCSLYLWDGSTALSGTAVSPPTAYDFINSDIEEAKPSGGAWDDAAVAAIQAGVEVIS